MASFGKGWKTESGVVDRRSEIVTGVIFTPVLDLEYPWNVDYQLCLDFGRWFGRWGDSRHGRNVRNVLRVFLARFSPSIFVSLVRARLTPRLKAIFVTAVVSKICPVLGEFTEAAGFREDWGRGSDIHVVRENTPPPGNRVKRKT